MCEYIYASLKECGTTVFVTLPVIKKDRHCKGILFFPRYNPSLFCRYSLRSHNFSVLVIHYLGFLFCYPHSFHYRPTFPFPFGLTIIKDYKCIMKNINPQSTFSNTPILSSTLLTRFYVSLTRLLFLGQQPLGY